MVLLTTRVWFLHFDLKYNVAILNYNWWETITNETNWYIRKKKTYGCLKFMWRYILCIAILWCMLTIICWIISERLQRISFTIGANICWVIMIWCFCKMPPEYDVLLIRKEINRLVIYYFICAVWYGVAAGASLGEKYLWMQWVSAFVSYSLTISMTTMSTLWPRAEQNRGLMFFKPDRLRSDIINKNLSLDKEQDRNNKSILSWEIYINQVDDDGNWNKFMRFLTRDFAIENLCFAIEVIQFKQQFIDNYDSIWIDNNVNAFYDDDKYGWLLKLPQGLPMSSIINQHDNEEKTESVYNRYKRQIQALHRKYISYDSNLAINISGHSRDQFMNDLEMISYSNIEVVQTLTDIPSESVDDDQGTVNIDIMSDIDKERLMKLFDNALLDIHQNLSGSFSRFQSTELVDQESRAKEEIADVMKIQT